MVEPEQWPCQCDGEKRVSLRNCKEVQAVRFMIDYMWELRKQPDFIVIDRMIVISGLCKLGIYGACITLFHFYSNKSNKEDG